MNQHGSAMKGRKQAKKVLLLHEYWQNHLTKSANETVCTFFYFFLGQLASHSVSPLNHKTVHRTWSLPRALAVVCFSQKRQFPFTCLMYSQWVMDVKKILVCLKVRHKEHVLADCWWHKQVTKTEHYWKVNTHHLKNVIARHNTGLIMALSVQDDFTSKSNLLSSMLS